VVMGAGEVGVAAGLLGAVETVAVGRVATPVDVADGLCGTGDREGRAGRGVDRWLRDEVVRWLGATSGSADVVAVAREAGVRVALIPSLHRRAGML